MPCLHFHPSKKVLKKKQRTIIAIPQPINGNTPHNPWEEETRAIRQAMGGDLTLPGVAQIPSSSTSSSSNVQPEQQTSPRAARPNIIAGHGLQVDPAFQHIEKKPCQQASLLPGWEAIEWNERGFATRYEYVGDDVDEDYDPEEDGFEMLTTPTRKARPAPKRLRDKRNHKPPEQFSQAVQSRSINLSRPLRPSGEHRFAKTKDGGETPPTLSSIHKTATTHLFEQKLLVSPPWVPVLRSPARFKSRLGNSGAHIGSPPARSDPVAAMRQCRKLLHAIHDLANRLLEVAKTGQDGPNSLLPSMTEVLTRTMRSAFAMWRLLRSINYDADMVYIRDNDLLSDLASHLEGMASRIVPPKQTGTTTSATAAAELDTYVKTLFRLGARLMLTTGLGKEIHAEGWESMREKSQLEAVRAGFERQAMSVEMKVEARLHGQMGEGW